jgi:hypothetical protein
VWLGGRFALTVYAPSEQAFRQILLPQTQYYQAVTELALDAGASPGTVAETDREGNSSEPPCIIGAARRGKSGRLWTY